ncbi:SMP-30/gluconolactonase/LRE family protein [Paractinoplanes durhamensis]|uniref:Strictosidine synthase n=1 Tax=Paractinoplanes durhamensis TaxID=113563 RepID=A0ABQ3YTV6_9ACTN|nr:SMP-30/gluconolactonase/LRE family protein [Actinoplanes durhamensis]GIE01037.1 strictosidine synthase [Actinoplanes durhamensis]
MDLRVVAVPGFGAEDVVVATGGPFEGRVFTGTEDGNIFWVAPDGQVGSVGSTGGRPLGLEFLPDGRLLVCDARLGLLAVDLAGGGATDGTVGGSTRRNVETLLDTVAGLPMRFCNNAAVAGDGTIYFSDSSTVHPIDEWRAEVVEVTRTGRLLRRTPDGQVDVLVDGLAFANGVALAGDESFVVVAETAARTLVRYWLTGAAAGTKDFLVADLPGYPDNISRGSDGLIWVAVASPKDPVVERLQRGPLWLRRQVTRIPEKLQPAPKRTVRVQAYGNHGELKRDLRAPGDRFHMVTGVREHAGQVWLGSLHEPAIAVLTSGESDSDSAG